MYEKVIIGVLLLGCISTTTVESSDTTQSSPVNASSKNETLDETTAQSKTPAIPTAENEREEELTTRSQVHTERGTGTRGQQFAHTFSQPVIIVIIFGVMAGIIGTILLVSYGIGRLQKKSLPQEQPPFSNDEGPPLSSVETGNPEM
ncbi:glycophorin-A [Pteropus alecto]|uniref:glycophorin-A n=1 Tax=Pteropus alecto TaxID=9402 RepID=UPI0003F119DE|nr:glycophorin-A [Pteropus alecto]